MEHSKVFGLAIASVEPKTRTPNGMPKNLLCGRGYKGSSVHPASIWILRTDRQHSQIALRRAGNQAAWLRHRAGELKTANDPKALTTKQIAERISALGLECTPWDGTLHTSRFLERSGRDLLAAVSGSALTLGFALQALASDAWRSVIAHQNGSAPRAGGPGQHGAVAGRGC